MIPFHDANKIKKSVHLPGPQPRSGVAMVLAIVSVMAESLWPIPSSAQSEIVWLRCDFTISTSRGGSGSVSAIYEVDSANNRLGLYTSHGILWFEVVNFSATDVEFGDGQYMNNTIDRQSLAFSYASRAGSYTETGQGQCQKVDGPTGGNQF
jgi:hypothetical protein